MRVLSLFSGGGLGDYGLTLAGMEIVGQVEIDEYCQKILSLRWPEVPKWRDIRDVKGAEVVAKCGAIDIISGGFPCQDISQAGSGNGISGERSGLWKEMLRLISEIRPRYAFMENVSILTARGLGVVLGDLAEIGYDSEWECLPASAFGANHKRERIWIVAYPNNGRLFHGQVEVESTKERFDAQCELESSCSNVADSDSKRLERPKQLWKRFVFIKRPSHKSWWSVEPSVGRVANGTSNRVDRLKCLGNGQVVQVVEWIGKRIMEYESRTEPKL